MTGKTNFCQAVPLVIYHDWSATISSMQKMIQLEKHADMEPYGPADHFLLKSLGVLSKHWDSKSWYKFAGPAISSTMPWLAGMLKYMSDLEPDDGSISFLNGDAGGHIDSVPDVAALNYIFYSTDSQANTWFQQDGMSECHNSDVGTAWIIDTQARHGVQNSGTRYSLSIHFKVDYSTVKNWFASKTQQDLTFG
jgi:hypothetical protein